jgi:hypothetical protein
MIGSRGVSSLLGGAGVPVARLLSCAVSQGATTVGGMLDHSSGGASRLDSALRVNGGSAAIGGAVTITRTARSVRLANPTSGVGSITNAHGNVRRCS